MRRELLSLKESALDDSGNAEPIQIVKDAKMSRFTVRVVCCGDQANRVAGQPLCWRD